MWRIEIKAKKLAHKMSAKVNHAPLSIKKRFHSCEWLQSHEEESKERSAQQRQKDSDITREIVKYVWVA